MPAKPLEQYERLVKAARSNLRAAEVAENILSTVEAGLDFLSSANQLDLESKVEGKSYFMFALDEPRKRSRPINAALFSFDLEAADESLSALLGGSLPEGATADEVDRALYTAVMAYCASADLLKSNDKKTPGTFFEILLGHTASNWFQSSPSRQITVPTLGKEITLPTDLNFDLGPAKSRIHMPVKLSTRERVVQVWAHQRVLDGMHGVGRFRGLLMACAETNKQGDASVVEVCLPNQWIAYQMYIAQMYRVYYLDPPEKYLTLGTEYPFINVSRMSNFFFEIDNLTGPT
ncbi:MAG: hypothetical protein AAF962_22575 [Actinomycetota bacterium]